MKAGNRRIVILIAVAFGLALTITLFSPFASSSPDGLERVAENEEFIDTAKDAPYKVIADYVFPGVDNERLATVLAGITGVLAVTAVTSGLAFGLSRLGSRQRSSDGING